MRWRCWCSRLVPRPSPPPPTAGRGRSSCSRRRRRVAGAGRLLQRHADRRRRPRVLERTAATSSDDGGTDGTRRRTTCRSARTACEEDEPPDGVQARAGHVLDCSCATARPSPSRARTSRCRRCASSRTTRTGSRSPAPAGGSTCPASTRATSPRRATTTTARTTGRRRSRRSGRATTRSATWTSPSPFHRLDDVTPFAMPDADKTLTFTLERAIAAGEHGASDRHRAGHGRRDAHRRPRHVDRHVLDFVDSWQRCDAAGDDCPTILEHGRPRDSYTLTADDLGATLRFAVAARNEAGRAVAVSAPVDVLSLDAPANTSRPTITGAVEPGQRLIGNPGTWTAAPTFAYQWQHCAADGTSCTNIDRATGPTYALSTGDAGFRMRLVVTATNDAGSATASSDATAAPERRAAQPGAADDPRQRRGRRAADRVPGLVDLALRLAPVRLPWLRCEPADTTDCVAIDATGDVYTVTACRPGLADQGRGARHRRGRLGERALEPDARRPVGVPRQHARRRTSSATRSSCRSSSRTPASGSATTARSSSSTTGIAATPTAPAASTCTPAATTRRREGRRPRPAGDGVREQHQGHVDGRHADAGHPLGAAGEHGIGPCDRAATPC